MQIARPAVRKHSLERGKGIVGEGCYEHDLSCMGGHRETCVSGTTFFFFVLLDPPLSRAETLLRAHRFPEFSCTHFNSADMPAGALSLHV